MLGAERCGKGLNPIEPEVAVGEIGEDGGVSRSAAETCIRSSILIAFKLTLPCRLGLFIELDTDDLGELEVWEVLIGAGGRRIDVRLPSPSLGLGRLTL